RRAEDHRVRAAVERGQTALELDVWPVRAADEAYRAGPRAERARRALFRLDDLRTQRHAEVRVGVHADELAIALTGEPYAWPAVAGRWQHLQHDGLRAFRRALLLQSRDATGQNPCNPIERHDRSPVS